MYEKINEKYKDEDQKIVAEKKEISSYELKEFLEEKINNNLSIWECLILIETINLENYDPEEEKKIFKIDTKKFVKIEKLENWIINFIKENKKISNKN